jgi:hypothetical protein
MKDFLHASPPLTLGTILEGSLHRIQNGPPLLYFRGSRRLSHFGRRVFASIFEMAEEDTVSEKD